MELLGWVVASAFAPPGEAFRQELELGTLEEALGELLGRKVTLPHPPLTELQAAYTRLFVNHPSGAAAPPYTAYARDGVLFGPSYQALVRAFQEGGLEVQETWRDLPDHVASLGEAMALLAPRRPDLARWLLLNYLEPWVARYRPAVAREDPTGFYSTLMGLLEEALHGKKNLS